MTYTIEELRRAWLAAALAEWQTGVYDFEPGGPSPTPRKIHGYFAANGWSGWNGGRYTENARTHWCGHFAGAMGLRIGAYLEPGQAPAPVTLAPEVALFCMPSTKRLASRRKWQAAGERMPKVWTTSQGVIASTDGERVPDWTDVLRPGMIATVATSGNDPVNGDHVVIVAGIGEGLHTVEGNGRGFDPNGEYVEGVVVRDERKPRAFGDIVRVYDFTRDHFEEWTQERDR